MNMVEWKQLGDCIISLKTGLNPRKNFVLNSEGSTNYYITVRELDYWKINPSDKTDKIDDNAIKIINNRSNLEEGDVLFSGTGTIGRTALVNETPKNWNIKEGVYTIKPKKDVLNSKFLIELFHSYYLINKINEYTVGDPIRSVPMKNLVQIQIPIPDIIEQERIVDILDTFTSSINNLKQQIAQRRKQYEFYRDQLLDFKGNDIIEKLSFGGDFMLKARIGWQGLTKKEYRDSGEYKLITGTDFTKYNRIDFDNCVYVDKDRYDQDPYIQIHEDDVLITKDGTLGKIAYIDKMNMPATLNGGVFVVRDKSSLVLQKFLMYYLTSSYFLNWMKHNHTQGSIQHLTQALLSKFSIPVVSKDKQIHIIEKSRCLKPASSL